MCRLLGWSAPGGASALELLAGDTARLRALSRLHQDGWGAAWLDDDGELQRTRHIDAAHATEDLDAVLRAAHGTSGLVHLRWATDDLSVRLENTHPFVLGDTAFAHNGAVRLGPVLDSLIDPDLAAHLQGDTDSERYFLALQSARRTSGSLVEAVGKLVAGLGEGSWSSLNFVMVEPRKMHALCLFDPSRHPAGQDEDYFQLSFRIEGTDVVVWSSGVRHEQGSELPNGHLLTADLETGEVTLQPL